MRIGLDFDRVLFDTDSFNEYLKENVEHLEHIEVEPYDSNGNYSPEKHAELCGISPERIYDVIDERVEKFVFDGLEVLESLKESHELVIVTRGKKKFQEAKIENSGVTEVIPEYTVVERDGKDVASIEFLVDDRSEEIERAGLPGFVFDYEENDFGDIVREVRDYEAG